MKISSVPIVKIDVDKRLVFGWANVPFPVAKSDDAPVNTEKAHNPDGSLERVIEDVNDALNEHLGIASDDFSDRYWTVATFPTFVIASKGDEYFRFPMVRDEDGESITFGQPTEVETVFVAKLLKEQHDQQVPKTDLQGDSIQMDELEDAVYDFVLKSRQGGVNHETIVANLVESFVVTDEKLEAMGLDETARAGVSKGWWVGFKVFDDDVWARVRSGALAMFSIAGSATVIEVED